MSLPLSLALSSCHFKSTQIHLPTDSYTGYYYNGSSACPQLDKLEEEEEEGELVDDELEELDLRLRLLPACRFGARLAPVAALALGAALAFADALATGRRFIFTLLKPLAKVTMTEMGCLVFLFGDSITYVDPITCLSG
jgi:hypothetical protein